MIAYKMDMIGPVCVNAVLSTRLVCTMAITTVEIMGLSAGVSLGVLGYVYCSK